MDIGQVHWCCLIDRLVEVMGAGQGSNVAWRRRLGDFGREARFGGVTLIGLGFD